MIQGDDWAALFGAARIGARALGAGLGAEAVDEIAADAMCRYLERYDAKRGAPSTYIKTCVRAAYQCIVRDRARMISGCGMARGACEGGIGRAEAGLDALAFMRVVGGKERFVVWMRYWRQDTWNDIAQALGVSSKWARELHKRALGRMKRQARRA